MSSPSRENLGLLLGFIGVVMFGATLPMTRLATPELGPWFIAFGRAGVAGVAALALVLLLRRKIPPRDTWIAIAISALTLILGFAVFMGLAMLTVPASHGGVVLSALPLATSVMAVLLTHERPSVLFWLCAVAGAGLVLVYSLRHGGAGGLAMGDLLLLGAVASAATGYTLSGKLSLLMPGWEVITWALVLALPITLPATIWLWPEPQAAVSPSTWWAFAYLALISMFAGFFFWNAGLAMGGIARVSQVQLFQSFVTIALAAWINHEAIGVETWGFALAVMLVVALGRKARAR